VQDAAVAAGQFSAALPLGRGSPALLSGAASERLHARALRLADALSRAALEQSPLNVAALRVRAEVLEAQGHGLQAAALYRFAGTRSWRDNAVQAWLLQDALKRADFAEAFGHADALVRRRDAFQPATFLLFEVAAADPRAAAALAARLDQRPPWREGFLAALARSPQTDAVIAALVQRVDAGPAPLSSRELGDVPQRLAREGRYLDAYRTLRTYRGGRKFAVQPFDGGFDHLSGVPPFAWDWLNSAGASLDVAPSPGRPGDPALRVAYDGFSATDLLRQAVALEPGAYRLSGEIYAEAGDPGRLRWEARCIASGQRLGTGPASGAQGWAAFHLDFTVPPTGCDGVWLALTGTPGERRAPSATWFNNLRIAPA